MRASIDLGVEVDIRRGVDFVVVLKHDRRHRDSPGDCHLRGLPDLSPADLRSNGRWWSDLPRSVGVWSGGFIAGILATAALVELAGMAPLLAQVIAVALVAVLSYPGHKCVSFRR